MKLVNFFNFFFFNFLFFIFFLRKGSQLSESAGVVLGRGAASVLKQMAPLLLVCSTTRHDHET